MGRLEHFEIPANDPDRASKFYQDLFGWNIHKITEPTDYWLISTPEVNGNVGVGGGIYKKSKPTEGIQPSTMMLYFTVDNIEQSANEVKELKGQVLSDRIEVPSMGFFYTCADTEGNQFAIWEDAK